MHQAGRPAISARSPPCRHQSVLVGEAKLLALGLELALVEPRKNASLALQLRFLVVSCSSGGLVGTSPE